MSLSAKINSDNVLEVNGLYNMVDDAFINDATVEATLYDKDGNQMSGQTWPVSIDYVSSSDGIYRGVLLDSIPLTISYPYRLVVTMVKDSFDREIVEEVYGFVK